MKPYLVFLLVIMFGCGAARPDRSLVKPVKTVSVGKGPDAMFLTPDGAFLYVANVEDTLISVIDTETDEVTAVIDGTDYPWGFTRLGQSSFVAVSGWAKGVDIIDFSSHEIVRSKDFDHHLGGICSSHDGKALFVVGTEARSVFRLDAGTLDILEEFPTGDGPDGIGISKDDSKIYVTNTKDGTISIIRIADQSSDLIETGGKPELIHYNQDHSRLFISNFDRNVIHVLDTETDQIVRDIEGLSGPEEAVLSAFQEKLYVVNFESSRVFVYDAQTFEKSETEYLAGSKPIGVIPAINNSKLYVTNYGDNSVSVFNLK